MTITKVTEKRWRTNTLQRSNSKDLRTQMLTVSSIRTLKSSRMVSGKNTTNHMSMCTTNDENSPEI